ncbi:uncharacterized protein LOC117231098 [Bombus vosnesenskii]|uniref:Uncharacterized protein LOC117231098 n=1 Tax=Bombus vosnesenskii TaxID=207650 RepID=A0A6J3JY79_9HYME|nr:uncharacterized protein LOC117231098 [Bombus vosnesenskii]XP_033345085.1 uncharacterized protein LOC117231098 [Bombus vosnesenskii]
MNKISRTLVKNSMIIHKWTTLSNFSTISSYDVSIVKNLITNNEILDNENTMKYIEENIKNMDAKTAVKTINILYQKFNRNIKLDQTDFTNSKGFGNICKVILKDVRSLSRYDTINILRCLLFFNVPANSVLIQTLLQMIRVSLNDFTVGQIMILYSMLYDMEKSFLSESLLRALPYAFKQQAQIELNSDSTNLFQALNFCSMINNLTVKRHILRVLQKNKNRINLYNVMPVFNAIYSLPKLCLPSTRLLSYVQHMILINCNRLNFFEIEHLLHCISKKVLNSEKKFYNEALIDKLCSTVLIRNTTFQQKLIILQHLNDIRFCNIPLLNCLVEKCLKNPNILERYSIDIHTFIKGYIIADYIPHNWETIGRKLQNLIITIDCSVSNTVSTAFHLLSLNFYCPELIEKSFILYNSSCEKNSFLPVKDITLSALKLYWCVKQLYPEYNGFVPDESKLNEIKIERDSSEIPYLIDSLKEAVGGTEYIKSGLRTKFGEFVDYVVVIQPDGSFINTNNYDNITFVEELASLTECSKILFFAFPIEAYSINKGNLLSTVKIQLKIIETLPGFHSFVINPYLWEKFSDKEKVLHLQKAIQLKQYNSK